MILTWEYRQTICEVYGRGKQGAAFGYTKVRGYHPQLATLAETGQVVRSPSVDLRWIQAKATPPCQLPAPRLCALWSSAAAGCLSPESPLMAPALAPVARRSGLASGRQPARGPVEVDQLVGGGGVRRGLVLPEAPGEPGEAHRQAAVGLDLPPPGGVVR